jgi:hypothetical protein
MSIKSKLKIPIRKLFRKRMIRPYNNIINQKINNLKKENLYRSFPFDKISPTIYKYPFRYKFDKYYFDFYYSVSLIPSPDYIPASIYYLHIEPVLNDIRFAKNIENKALYDKYLKGIKSPNTILRKINGFYYDKDYHVVSLTDNLLKELCANEMKLILKPALDSGGGKYIKLFKKNKDRFLDDNTELNSQFLMDFPEFVLQEAVIQHNFFEQFNPTSNNTIRILTYRSVISNEIHVLQSLLRVGEKGSFMDHDNLGGIAIGITTDGKLNKYGTNSNGIKFYTFNGINFNEINQMPFYEEILKMAKEIASQIYYGRFLAIDFTVNLKGYILLLEINCLGNGISQYQMNSGPLLKEFTKEILDYCLVKDTKYTLKI